MQGIDEKFPGSAAKRARLASPSFAPQGTAGLLWAAIHLSPARTGLLPGAVSAPRRFSLSGKKEPEGSQGSENREMVRPVLIFSGAVGCPQNPDGS